MKGSELDAMKLVQHKTVVRVEGHVTDDCGQIYGIVMPLLGGDLGDVVLHLM